MQKPLLPSMYFFLVAIGLLVAGTIFRFQLLPSALQAYTVSDEETTILTGGTIPPLERFWHFLSHLSYGLAGLALLAGIVGLLTLNEPRRRYIAQLPRWQQWLVWPFHGVETPGCPPSSPAA